MICILLPCPFWHSIILPSCLRVKTQLLNCNRASTDKVSFGFAVNLAFANSFSSSSAKLESEIPKVSLVCIPTIPNLLGEAVIRRQASYVEVSICNLFLQCSEYVDYQCVPASAILYNSFTTTIIVSLGQRCLISFSSFASICLCKKVADCTYAWVISRSQRLILCSNSVSARATIIRWLARCIVGD